MFNAEERRSIGGAVEGLGLELLRKLPIGPQQPNVIMSPLSVAFALAQLTLGQSDFFQPIVMIPNLFLDQCFNDMLTC